MNLMKSSKLKQNTNLELTTDLYLSGIAVQEVLIDDTVSCVEYNVKNKFIALKITCIDDSFQFFYTSKITWDMISQKVIDWRNGF